MLTLVEVRNSAGDLLNLPLDDATDGLVVADIRGLEPVKATLVSSSFAQMDGTQYQTARRENRNLVLTIELYPNYVDQNPRSLRSTLYGYFMPKSLVDLKFVEDTGFEVEISGRVETFDTRLFAKEPAIDISIICFDPDFLETEPVEISEETVADSSEVEIVYEGTVETGVVFVLNLDRDLEEFTIYHRGPDNVTKSMDFAADLLEGDILTISTVKGNKSITLNRSGTQSSLLYALSPQSPWIELSKGDNYIRFYAVGDPIPYELSFIQRHGGL